MFRPTVKWGGPIFAWERIPEVVRIAFREMWIGRPGPGPHRVPDAGDLRDRRSRGGVRSARPRSYRASLPQPSRRAAARGRRAARARRAARSSSRAPASTAPDANAALLRLVEMLGCPVITTMAGRATVPLDHPQHLDGFGPGGDVARREADVILVVGSRLGNLDLPYDKYWGDPARAKLIQIDIDPRHHRRDAAARARHRRRRRRRRSRRWAALLESRAARPRRREATWRATAKSARAGGRAQSRADRELDRTGPPPGARDAGGRRGFGRDADLRDRRRHDVALGARVPAADPAALVPQHPRARHARHRASRPRSARSSRTPSARSSASPATAPPASTSWRCSRPRARG